ncbi:MAG TPA: Clp protease N-terminal domain-containing protein [Ktedonobacterales bacterium]|nr:Clp protease N-terminal domain-containing protein [Ktedonobacterales bacterium]
MFRRNVGQSDRDRFDKFTERARKVLSLAQEEAQRFNHNYIGTEHILLGLVREGDGVGAKVLRSLGVELQAVRREVERVIGRGDRIVLGDIGLTPRAKKVMELAVDEARRLNHHYIGTEHILLGLIREGEGIAAGVLESLGINLERVRTQTIQVLSQSSHAVSTQSEQEPETPAGGLRSNVVTCRLDDRTLDAVDALVEAGVRATRSEAAAWLIAAGIEANRELFTRVNATIAEIRRLRAEAQAIAQQVVSGAEPSQPPTADETNTTSAQADGEKREEGEPLSDNDKDNPPNATDAPDNEY